MNDDQPDRDAILTMARLAGLRLPAAYENELVHAYTHVRALVLRLPEPRARSDEPAHVFNHARFVANDRSPWSTLCIISQLRSLRS